MTQPTCGRTAVCSRVARWLPVMASAVALALSAEAAAARPNIVLIMSDDMGYSDLGCYGGEIHTPQLDDLAEGGLRFTQFYNTGRCCPTRASLLTGLYPHQAGIGHMMNDRGHDGYRGELNRQCVTIAEVLRPAGYATYMVGKWHVTQGTRPEGPQDNWPLQRGFDRFYGTITGAGSFFDPGTLTRDNTMISPLADPAYQPETYYYTDAISDHAVQFIHEHQQQPAARPFFMYVAYTAAHWPMHALEKDIARYRGRSDEGYAAIRQRRLERVRELGLVSAAGEPAPLVGHWAEQEHPEWEARCMEVYAAMIDNMDQGIGRIVETLRRHGQLDNTLILFCQDNGGCQEGVGRSGDWKRPVEPSLPVIAADAIRLDVIPRQNRAGVPTLQGPHVMPGPADTYIAYGLNWANVSNTPFREYKHFVHEGGISTPLIAHWPAGCGRAGELEHQPGHLIDLLATCVDVAGATYPSEVGGQPIRPREGVSLVPALQGRSLDRRQPLYWEHEGNRAIRDGKWKLVAKEQRPWELYDMTADRSETRDLAEDQPEVVARLAARWEAWAERAQVLPLGTWRGDSGARFNREQKRFQLAADAELQRGAAPFVVNRPLAITARLARWGDGVVIAQGGSSHGYALYVQDGQLQFVLRRDGQLSHIRLPGDAPPDGPVTIEVHLDHDGQVTLAAGEIEQRGTLPGLLSSMPVDGLQIGRDNGGAVGPYAVPFAFQGVIEDVTIELPAAE